MYCIYKEKDPSSFDFSYKLSKTIMVELAKILKDPDFILYKMWLILVQRYIWHKKYSKNTDSLDKLKKIYNSLKIKGDLKLSAVDNENSININEIENERSEFSINETGHCPSKIKSNNNIINKNIEMSDSDIIQNIIKTKQFPLLYKTDNRTNKKRFWKIWMSESDEDITYINIQYGVVGTKKPVNKNIVVKSGKNIGKTNETSRYNQGFKQALKKFKDKLRDMSINYKTDIKSDIIYPMIGEDYGKLSKKNKKRMRFPCYVQIKFDGERCISKWDPVKKKIILYSRGKHYIHGLPDIEKDLRDCFSKTDFDTNLYLDGELYIHGKTQNDIHGIISKRKNMDSINNLEDKKKLKYFVFDCYIKNKAKLGFNKRMNIIKKLLMEKKDNCYKRVLYVDSIFIKTEEIMKKFTKNAIDNGFEGSILRSKYGIYKPAYGRSSGRSKDIQKYKIEKYSTAFIDRIEERINMNGFVFVCNDKDSKISFNMTANGTVKYKQYVLSIRDQFTGKYIRYKYLGLTGYKKPISATPVLDKLGEYMIETMYDNDENIEYSLVDISKTDCKDYKDYL